MLALLVGTLISASFNLIVRWGQARKANLLAVGAINYSTAALVYALLWAGAGSGAPASTTWKLGVLGGLAYVIAYFFLLPAQRLRGVSIASALVRLSVLIPIGLSLSLWHERPTLIQMCGIAAALISLPLLSYRPGERLSASWREYFALAGLFVLNGFCLTAIKAFREYGATQERVAFFLLLFTTAAVVSACACVVLGEVPRRRDLAPGVLLGLCNVSGNFLLLYALQGIPGVVAFPFNSAVGLAYAVAMAHWLWHERVSRLERVGIAVALAAVVLVVR